MNTARRDILRILGIGGAAGLGGCSRTAPDQLLPYVTGPEGIARGDAVWLRSTCRECPAGCGLEARVCAGRVQKLEGNPEHPVNAGGLCARGQAALQGLYHPDRLRAPLVRDAQGRLGAASWDTAFARVAAALAPLDPRQVAVITGCATGPLPELAGLLGRRLQYEAIGYETLREANRLTFGTPSLPVLRWADARAVYVFATDVTATFLSPVGYARGISEARRAGGRMVYFGSRLSLTGAHADQWVSLEAGGEGRLAMALVRQLLTAGGAGHLRPEERERLRRWSAPFTPERAGVPPALIEELAHELLAQPALAVTGGL
jgi:molybdopterin-containing oxidoreductase family iron-sulfur binding subunit